MEEIQSLNGIQNLTPGQTIRVPVQKEKKQAGYYQTGEGEQLTFTQGGQTIRLGENSSISPNRPENKFQQFMQVLTGQAGNDGASYQAGVSGDQMSDTQYQNLAAAGVITPSTAQTSSNTITTGEGEYKTVTGPNGEQIRVGPNSTYTPSPAAPPPGFFNQALQYFQNLSGNWGEPASQPSSIRGSTNKGINGMASPVRGQGPGMPAPGGMLKTKEYGGRGSQPAPWTGGAFSYAPQGWYSHDPSPQTANYTYAPYTPPTRLGLNSQPVSPSPYTPFWSQGIQRQASYAPQGQPNSYQPYPRAATPPPNQFSYAPPGQPNSYQPYSSAKFITNQIAGQLNNPQYNSGNIFTNQYAGPAINKSAQERWQQGDKSSGSRSWIGGNGRKYEDQINQYVAPKPVYQLVGNQAINWRA